MTLLTKLDTPEEREWYAAQALQRGWSRTTLEVQIKAPDDNPTIGLLLCKTQNRMIAEYALSGIEKPIGVAEYELLRQLPQNLAGKLPTIEELEQELINLPDEVNRQDGSA